MMHACTCVSWCSCYVDHHVRCCCVAHLWGLLPIPSPVGMYNTRHGQGTSSASFRRKLGRAFAFQVGGAISLVPELRLHLLMCFLCLVSCDRVMCLVTHILARR